MASRKSREDLTPTWLKDIVQSEVMDLLARYVAIHGSRRPDPAVRFTSTGAQDVAVSDKKGLSFNPALFLAYPELMLAESAPHAVAHWIDGARSAHGRKWHSIMATLGVESPKRSHSYEVTENHPHIYGCSCEDKGVRFTDRRHAKSVELPPETGEDLRLLSPDNCQACKDPYIYLHTDPDTSLRIDAAGLARVQHGLDWQLLPATAGEPIDAEYVPIPLLPHDELACADGPSDDCPECAPAQTPADPEPRKPAPQAGAPDFTMADAKKFLAPFGVPPVEVAACFGESASWEGAPVAIWAVVSMRGEEVEYLVPLHTQITLNYALQSLAAVLGDAQVVEYTTSDGRTGPA